MGSPTRRSVSCDASFQNSCQIEEIKSFVVVLAIVVAVFVEVVAVVVESLAIVVEVVAVVVKVVAVV